MSFLVAKSHGDAHWQTDPTQILKKKKAEDFPGQVSQKVASINQKKILVDEEIPSGKVSEWPDAFVFELHTSIFGSGTGEKNQANALMSQNSFLLFF